MMFGQFLVGFTDVWVAGHISRDAQAVLGVVTQCQFTLLIVGTALAAGGIAVISQSLGARLPLRGARYSGMLLKYGLMFSFVALALALVFRGNILRLLEVPESIFPLAEYFWLLFLASLPSNYLLSLTGAMFRARRMVFIPLAASLLACAVNFVTATGFGLGWWGLPAYGIEGMALATFCSVTAAALYNLFMAFRKDILNRRAFAPWRWERKAFGYLLKVALPSGGSQLLWQLGYLVLFGVVGSLPYDSINALAGMTAGMRIESIVFLPAFALNMTSAMLVGHCLGAGDRDEARRISWRIVTVGCLAMSTAALCLWPFVGRIAVFISPDAGAQAYVVEYLRFNLLSTPFSVGNLVFSGAMAGAGATLYPLVISGASIWLVRLPLAWFIGHYLGGGPWGVFLAMFISQMVQAIAMLFTFQRRDWAGFAMTAGRMKTVESRRT